jgi:hypothetical protein
VPKTASVVRAISIRQPYVEQILRGLKKREYRSRRTNIRERVYLYASLRPAEWPSEWRKVKRKSGDLPVGIIARTVEIVDCRWDRRTGCYAYILRSPVRFRRKRFPRGQPTPCFWRPRF